jgi:hypothetical protein
MTRLDVHAWIGSYPWRHLPSHDPAALRDMLAQEGFDGAWVGHLPSAWYRDPTQGNRELVQALKPHAGVLHPAPCIRPDWPRWRDELTFALDHGARAIRAYPMQWGLGPEHPAWLELGHAVAEAGVVLVLTQRFEDLRQRHALDAAGDLTAAHVRALARATSARVIVGAAGRALMEETHFGLTAAEQRRVWYDVAWLWGPPEDELALMVETIGPARLVEGSGWPLRLAEQLRAARDLLPSSVRGVQWTSADAVLMAARERP